MKYNVLQAICVGTDPVQLSIRSKDLSCTGTIWRVIVQRRSRSRPYLWVIRAVKKQDRQQKGSQEILLGLSRAEGDSELRNIF